MSVLVYVEILNGNLKKSSLEALNYGSKVANTNNSKVSAIIFSKEDDSKLQELGKYGADKVIKIQNEKFESFHPHAFAKVIADIVVKENSQLVIFSNTYSSKAIAPLLSIKINAALVPGVISLPKTENGFIVRRNGFSGKAFIDVDVKTEKKILTLTPNSFPLENIEKSVVVEKSDVSVDEKAFSVEVKEVKKVSGKIPLTEAELVVSAGRGMKGPENWGMVEELAGAIGATTACSKPVADMEWRPHSEHVGQTGITIRPNLYIAIGISGAIQHLAGVNGSKKIVVINKDAEAPFFKAADYGVVGDAFEIVPKLTEAVKKFKASH